MDEAYTKDIDSYPLRKAYDLRRILPLSPLLIDALVLLAGSISTLAFAPFEYGFVIFISLFVLFLSWQGIGAKRVFLRGFLFGLGQFGFGSFWIYISIHDFGGTTLIEASALACLFVGVLALFPAFVGLIVTLGFRLSPAVTFTLVYPPVWTLVEWSRSWILNGFPWLQIGYTQLDSPLAGFIPFWGVYGQSWLVAVIVGIAISFIGFLSRQKLFSASVITLFFLIGWCFKQIEWTEPIGKPFKVTLVQGNIPQDIKWLPEQRIGILSLYAQLSRENWQSRLIVWPETAAPAYYRFLKDDFFKPLKTEALKYDTDLIFGIPVLEGDGDRYYNTVMTLGKTDGIYKKRHLVPFGEYMPLQPLTGFIANVLDIPLSDFSAGDDNQLQMRAAGYPFVASICYEDIYGDESLVGLPKGAYLVNITNDAWFGDSIAPHQHLQMARMRSLETGRYMIRAANTGASAFISPAGKIIRTAPLFTTLTLTEEIIPMAGSTPYIIWGDTPFLGGFFVLLTVAFWLTLKSKGESKY